MPDLDLSPCLLQKFSILDNFCSVLIVDLRILLRLLDILVPFSYERQCQHEDKWEQSCRPRVIGRDDWDHRHDPDDQKIDVDQSSILVEDGHWEKGPESILCRLDGVASESVVESFVLGDVSEVESDHAGTRLLPLGSPTNSGVEVWVTHGSVEI